MTKCHCQAGGGNFLAQYCYLPGERPDGVSSVAARRTSPGAPLLRTAFIRAGLGSQRGSRRLRQPGKLEAVMGLILLVLLLALLFGGLGFALHALWWVAIIILVVWLVGFAARAGEGRRWYRW